MRKENAELLSQCVHHWKIDTPDGPTSPGTCKHCGSEKNFKNTDEGPSLKEANTIYTNKRTRGPRNPKHKRIPKTKETMDPENPKFTDLQLEIGLAMSESIVGDDLWQTLGITASKLAIERKEINNRVGKKGDRSVKFIVHIVRSKLIPIDHLLEEPEPLTTDDIRVLDSLCRGNKNADIKSELCIGTDDVEAHLASAYLKLGTPGKRYQAVARYTALKTEGIIEPTNPGTQLESGKTVETT